MSVRKNAWDFHVDLWPRIIEKKFQNEEAGTPLPFQRFEVPLPDWLKKLYKRSPIEGVKIGKVELVYNETLTTSFEAESIALNSRGPLPKPKWQSDYSCEEELKRREATNAKLEAISKKIPGCPHVKLVPQFHVVSGETAENIFSTSFEKMEKDSPFGNGIYSSSSAYCALQLIEKEPILILSWVIYYSAYPMIHHPEIKNREEWENKDLEMKKRDWRYHTGGSHYENYDAHFVKVKQLFEPDQGGKYDQLIVFNHKQILPQYIITLIPSASKIIKFSVDLELDCNQLFEDYRSLCGEDLREALSNYENQPRRNVKELENAKVMGYLYYLIDARKRKVSPAIIESCEAELYALLPKALYSSVSSANKNVLTECLKEWHNASPKTYMEFSLDTTTSLDADIRRHKRVIIKGKFGVGKSSYCNYLVQAWASGQLWNDQFDAVFFLKWNDVKKLRANPGLGGCIYDNNINPAKRPLLSAPKINSYLYEYKDKVLLIIDDFEEMDLMQQNRLILMDYLREYPYWILTSTSDGLKEIPHGVFELLEFTPKKVISHLETSLTPEFAQNAITFLNSQPRMMDVCCLPRTLEFFIEIVKSTAINFSLLTSQTDIYCKLFENLYNKMKSEQQSFLEKLAFFNIQNNLVTFSFQKIRPTFLNNNFNHAEAENMIKSLERSGFLKISQYKDEFPETSYSFSQAPFQAFLAAKYLLHLLKEDNWFSSPGEDTLIEVLFDRKFRETIVYLARLAKEEKRVLDVFVDQIEKVDNLPQLLFQQQCLEECGKQPSIPLSQIDKWFKFLNTPEDWGVFIHFMFQMKKVYPKIADGCRSAIANVFSNGPLKERSQFCEALVSVDKIEDPEFACFLFKLLDEQVDFGLRINLCKTLEKIRENELGKKAIGVLQAIISRTCPTSPTREQAICSLGALARFDSKSVLTFILKIKENRLAKQVALIQMGIGNPELISQLQLPLFEHYRCVFFDKKEMEKKRIAIILSLAKAHPEKTADLLRQSLETPATSCGASHDIGVLIGFLPLKFEEHGRLIMNSKDPGLEMNFIRGCIDALELDQDLSLTHLFYYCEMAYNKSNISLKEESLKLLESLIRRYLIKGLSYDPLITLLVQALDNQQVRSSALSCLYGALFYIFDKEKTITPAFDFVERLLYIAPDSKNLIDKFISERIENDFVVIKKIEASLKMLDKFYKPSTIKVFMKKDNGRTYHGVDSEQFAGAENIPIKKPETNKLPQKDTKRMQPMFNSPPRGVSGIILR